MRTIFILICLSLSLSVFAAQPRVYKRVNPDGVVEFSDKPMEGAELMNVPKGTVVDLSPGDEVQAPPSEADEEKPPIQQYTRVEIITPKNDAPIRSNSGLITASVIIEPRLAEGDYIKWTLDGEEVANASTASLQLENVDRGSHQLQVTILNSDDVPLKTSNLVTFHLLRFAR